MTCVVHFHRFLYQSMPHLGVQKNQEEEDVDVTRNQLADLERGAGLQRASGKPEKHRLGSLGVPRQQDRSRRMHRESSATSGLRRRCQLPGVTQREEHACQMVQLKLKNIVIF